MKRFVVIAMAVHGGAIGLTSRASPRAPGAPQEEVASPRPDAAQDPPTIAVEFITLPDAPPGRSRPRIANRRQSPSRTPRFRAQPSTQTTIPEFSETAIPASASTKAALPASVASTKNSIGPHHLAPSTRASPGHSLAMRAATPAEYGVSASPPPGSEAGSTTPSSQLSEGAHWQEHSDGSYTAKGQPFEAHVAKDGTIVFNDKPNLRAGVVRFHGIPMPMIAGGFDLTDAVMASQGKTLYSARKLRLMDQSRDARAVMAIQARNTALAEAPKQLKRKLGRLWNDPTRSLYLRKSLLFELWDECAEEGEVERVEAANLVRSGILSFVKTALPGGSKDAYSRTELQAFNRRRHSNVEFRPY